MYANIFRCHKGTRGQTGSPQPQGDRLLAWEGTKRISQWGGRKRISWLIFLEFCRVNAWGCAWLVWMVATHLAYGEGKKVLQMAHPHHG